MKKSNQSKQLDENGKLHDNGRMLNVGGNGLVRQNRASVDVDFVGNSDILTQDSDTFNTRPATNGRVPSNDRGLDPGMVLDGRSLEDDAALETDTVANDSIGSNSNIRSDTAVFANLGRRVNENITTMNKLLRGRCKNCRVLFCERREVEAGARQEVLRLTDIHPVSLKIKRIEQTVLRERRESLLLDGGRTELDAVNDRGVEDVDTGVDAVADKLDGLLNETIDLSDSIGFVDNDTVL